MPEPLIGSPQRLTGTPEGIEVSLIAAAPEAIILVEFTAADQTAEAVTALVDRCQEWIAEGVAERFVLDLRAVRHMASAGLGQVVRLSRAAVKAGGGAATCGHDANLGFLFQVTHLDRLLPVCATREQAIDALLIGAARGTPRMD